MADAAVLDAIGRIGVDRAQPRHHVVAVRAARRPIRRSPNGSLSWDHVDLGEPRRGQSTRRVVAAPSGDCSSRPPGKLGEAFDRLLDPVGQHVDVPGHCRSRRRFRT